jgi:hypothetical protein
VSTVFDNHALAAMRTHAGTWHCMLCWAREANLNPVEDLARLRLLARQLAPPQQSGDLGSADDRMLDAPCKEECQSVRIDSPY